MSPRRRIAAALCLGLALVLIQPLAAQAQSGGDPETLLEEGTKQILRAFELFLMTIPQYHAPEVLPNGDIILRRKNPPETAPDGNKDGAPPPSTDEGGDKTKT